MNKEQEELLSKAYENYTQTIIVKNDDGTETHTSPAGHYNRMTKEEFIDKIKTDPEFSKSQGLTIEERELSREERIEFYVNTYMHGVGKPAGFEDAKLTTRNVPIKLIKLTYNDKTIESYENIIKPKQR
jgi:hypothetical protein